MTDFNPKLYLQLNNLVFKFLVGAENENNNLKILYELEVPVEGIENNRVSDLEIVYKVLKENIYLIEQKLNFTFKEVVLILENFTPKYLNLSGFKSLNGSQVVRENITYILNVTKSYINSNENKKTIIHIFNSSYHLDYKKIENLPIGLFGDFYSHELSFILINLNDYKNLKNIFDKCNLKINKIFDKNFIDAAYISENQKNTETFFKINIGNNHSKIFFFENNSLKSEQNFKFGTDIIIKDISKITSLDRETVKSILNQINFQGDISDEELISKDLFLDSNFRKIKKKLIYEIILARIKEICQKMIFYNINYSYYIKFTKKFFLEFDNLQENCIKEIFQNIIKSQDKIDLSLVEISTEDTVKVANKIVHFGWKKEAIPITQTRKSLIVKLFDAIFN